MLEYWVVKEENIWLNCHTHPFIWCSWSWACSWWSANIPDEPRDASFSFKTDAAQQIIVSDANSTRSMCQTVNRKKNNTI